MMTDRVRPDHCYRIAALKVRSFAALPALSAVFDQPDILVSRGRVPDCLEDPINDGGWWQVGRDRTILVRRNGLARMMVREGSLLVVDTKAAKPDDATLSFLMGPVFSAILIQQARLVFHGAAVAFGNHCALFIGGRGAGKSTMAGFFRLKGYPNLGDDLCMVDFEGETPMVEPVFPWIRLRTDTARFFREKIMGLPLPDCPGGRVTLMPETGLGHKARRLAAIYLLDSTPASTDFPGRVLPMPRGQAFPWLYRNLYGAPLARHMGVLAEMVQQILQIHDIPVYACPRATALAEKESQVNLIIRQMTALGE